MDQRHIPKTISDLITQIENEIQNNDETILDIRKLSGSEHKYFFFIKKPIIDLHLSTEYRTGVQVSLVDNGNSTECITKTQTPPYIPVLGIIILFFIAFNNFLLHTRDPISKAIPLTTIFAILFIVHSLSVERIKKELNNILNI